MKCHFIQSLTITITSCILSPFHDCAPSPMPNVFISPQHECTTHVPISSLKYTQSESYMMQSHLHHHKDVCPHTDPKVQNPLPSSAITETLASVASTLKIRETAD